MLVFFVVLYYSVKSTRLYDKIMMCAFIQIILQSLQLTMIHEVFRFGLTLHEKLRHSDPIEASA